VPRGAPGTMSARFSASEPSLFAGPATNPAGVAPSSRIADDERMADVPKLTADERAAIIRVLQRALETARFPLSPRLAPLRSALVKLDTPAPAAALERAATTSEQAQTEPRAALYRMPTRKAHWLPIIIGIPVLVGLIAAAMYWIDQSERTAHAVPTPVAIVAPPPTPAAAAPSTPASPAAAESPAPAPRFIIGIPTAQPPALPAAPAPPPAPPPTPPAGPTPNLVSGLPPLGATPQAAAPAAASPPPEAEAPAAPKQKHPRTAAPPPSGQVRF
jgi:hypothetical protein